MPRQVNEALMAATGKAETIFLHCLPAERGKETTDGVMESAQSHVFRQARAPRLPMAHHAHPDRAAGHPCTPIARAHGRSQSDTPPATYCNLLLPTAVQAENRMHAQNAIMVWCLDAALP